MIFGKLIDGRIHLFVNPLRIDGKDVFTNDPELLLEHGYKEVIYTDPPDDIPEGFVPYRRWEEDERRITLVWTLVPAFGEAEQLITEDEGGEIR